MRVRAVIHTWKHQKQFGFVTKKSNKVQFCFKPKSSGNPLGTATIRIPKNTNGESLDITGYPVSWFLTKAPETRAPGTRVPPSGSNKRSRPLLDLISDSYVHLPAEDGQRLIQLQDRPDHLLNGLELFGLIKALESASNEEDFFSARDIRGREVGIRTTLANDDNQGMIEPMASYTIMYANN